MMTAQEPAGKPAPNGKGKKRSWRSCCGCLGVGFIMLIILGIIGSFMENDTEDVTASEPSATSSEEAPEPEEAEASESPEPSPTPSQTSSSPSPTPTPTPTPTPEDDTATVTRVVDGDTLVLWNGDRVRLLGIDAPEQGECHADTATQWMTDLVEGSEVTLLRDGDDTDQYGRLLRYVDIDGTDAGLTLIEEGLAIARYDSRDGYGFHTREPEYIAADETTPLQECATQIAPEPEPEPQPAPQPPAGDNCDPNYVPCIPAYPPDLNCPDIGFPVQVIGADPHGLDRDGDGWGCESYG